MMSKEISIFFVGIFFIFLLPFTSYAALSCSITTVAACTGPSVVVLRMSGSSNAHVELPAQSNANYAGNAVCCSGVTGLGNLCSGTFATVAKLSAVTNAHIEQNSQTNYGTSACLSVTSGTVSIGYQASNCTGFDTTLASMSGVTNAHTGSSTVYTTKICASVSTAQSLSYSLSDNSIGFGTVTSGATRYATGDTLGTGTETEAHQLSVTTNATSGYNVTVQGATLTSQQNSANTITAIGGTNTAPSVGTEQFGLRLTATGGVGTVTVPYAASGFAYAATASTASQVASATSGDGVATVYSARYVANNGAQTEAGDYTASLVYVITANF